MKEKKGKKGKKSLETLDNSLKRSTFKRIGEVVIYSEVWNN